MSYHLRLVDPATRQTLAIDIPSHQRRDECAVARTSCASLPVSWNYAPIYRDVFRSRAVSPTDPKELSLAGDKTIFGICAIYGMTGAESIPVLGEAIARLHHDVLSNHWTYMEHRAERVLIQLLRLAQLHPRGVWDGK